MNTDYRVDVGFWRHRKTLRLIRTLGLEGPVALQKLWAHAAEFLPDGTLTGMDAIDIAEAAGWSGNPNHFLGTLLDHKWIDNNNGTFQIHDWSEHQPWVIKAPERREKARKAINARWDKRRPDSTMSNSCSITTSNSKSNTQGGVLSNSPSNTPSPFLNPSVKNNDVTRARESINGGDINGEPPSSFFASGVEKPVLVQKLVEILPNKYRDDAKTHREIREYLNRYSPEYIRAQISYVLKMHPDKNFRAYLGKAIARNYAQFDPEARAKEVEASHLRQLENEQRQANEEIISKKAEGILEAMNHTERINLCAEMIRKTPGIAGFIKEPTNEQNMLLAFLVEQIKEGELIDAQNI